MDGQTPYAPPGAPVGGSLGGTSAAAIEAANGTKPWVTFIAVLSSITTAFAILGTLVVGAVAAFGALDSQELGGLEGAAGVAIIVLVYGILAVVYLLITMKLWKMRSAIEGFAGAANEHSLVAMLQAHRSFWRTLGGIAAVVLGLYALIIVVAFGVGIFMGAAAAT